MAADGEITVVIDPAVSGGPPPASAPAAPAAPAAADTPPKVDPIKALEEQHRALLAKDEERQKELDRQRLATEEASRKAAAAEREIEETKTRSLDSDLDRVTVGLDAAQQSFNSAKIAYRAAMETGDWDKVTEAQIALNDAQRSVADLSVAKADLEAAKAAPPSRGPRSTGDPIEDFINRQTPQSAAWLRQRDRSWFTDPSKSNKISAAHYDALARGLKGDTPEYFAHIEEYIGDRKPAAQSPPPSSSPASLASGGSRVPPVAPVINAGSNAGVQGGGVEVRLSPTEAAAAQDGTHVWNYDDPSGQKRWKKGDPIGVQEFARRKQLMKEQGLYDKVYLEQ